MRLDHERIEELLAGYALLTLEDEDAAEADRLLAEHVPTCLVCRQTLADFQGLTGDLALAAPPVLVPDLVLGRIHRGMDEVPLAGLSRRGTYLALAASVAALVAMGGLSFSMAGRADRAETTTDTALEVLNAMRSPDVNPVTLDPQGETPDGSSFLEVATAEVRTLYLVTETCPEPDPGMAYQLWLGSGGTFVAFGPMFRPDASGRVILELEVDVSRYDEIWVTEERAGTAPSSPNVASPHSWRAALV